MELAQCPVETALMVIGDKWKILILWDMEAKGSVTREVFAEVPPRVEYSLTETGYSLRPVLDVLRHWGEGYQIKVKNK